jgi:hypothetical protein
MVIGGEFLRYLVPVVRGGVGAEEVSYMSPVSSGKFNLHIHLNDSELAILSIWDVAPLCVEILWMIDTKDRNWG